MTPTVLDWLCAADPAVAWQALRDLADAPEPQWQARRAAVETEGWGAALLSHADDDGWAHGACFPGDFSDAAWQAEGQPWTATMPTLAELRRFGLPPDCAAARRIIPQVAERCRWEYDASMRFFDGEVEPCINGQTVAIGAYFGVDMTPVVQRLLSEVQPDGGWNCERENGSVRSSFDTTICVLEGLRQYEHSGGAVDVAAACCGGEEFLLERGLFRRLRDAQVADPTFLQLRNPDRWHYSTLRALDYLRSTGAPPDARVEEALDIVAAQQLPDGRFPLQVRARGRVWFHPDEVGNPSPMITLKALRVLRWAGRDVLA